MMDYLCFNWEGPISTQNGGPLKLVDKFMYLNSSISSTESNVIMLLVKMWTAISRLLIIWKTDLSNKIKRDFSQAVVVSIILYGCTTRMLTKHIEKKLYGNCTRMLQAIFNKSWKQQATKQQLYGHLHSIFKTIQIRWTRHVEPCWRSKDKLISDILQRTPTHEHASVGRPQELTDNRSVWTQDVIWKTIREWWMIGTDGERDSQGNLCQQCDLIRMMIIQKCIHNVFITQFDSDWP